MTNLKWTTVINGQAKKASGIGRLHSWTYEVFKSSKSNWSTWITYGDGDRREIGQGGMSYARAVAAANDHHNRKGA